MNKFTHAVFSVFIALLLFFTMFLDFTTKFIVSIVIIGFLLATMIKMIFVVAFRKATGYANAPRYNVFELHGEQVKYA